MSGWFESIAVIGFSLKTQSSGKPPKGLGYNWSDLLKLGDQGFEVSSAEIPSVKTTPSCIETNQRIPYRT
jgi:hypothetical protein